MLRHTRGEKIPFTATFTDGAGDATQPTGATLYIAWAKNGCPQKTEIAMTDPEGDKTWVAEWDSREADPGRVYWHILTSDSAAIAEDGVILLDGNAANIARTAE